MSTAGRREELPDTAISSVAQRLRAMEAELGWSRSVAIGKLVLEAFFDGDPQQWQSRRGRHLSLRRLAEHPDCPLQKSALAEAVGVYVTTLETPNLVKSDVITPSHVARVLSLEPPARKRLLKEAEDLKMGVRTFANRVKQVKRTAGCGALPVESQARKVLNKVQDGLAAMRAARTLWEELDVTIEGRQESWLLEMLDSLEEEISLVRQQLAHPARRPRAASTLGRLERASSRIKGVSAA